jgi:hypothetical protein
VKDADPMEVLIAIGVILWLLWGILSLFRPGVNPL